MTITEVTVQRFDHQVFTGHQFMKNYLCFWICVQILLFLLH